MKKMEDSDEMVWRHRPCCLLCYILPGEKKCAGMLLKDRTSHLNYHCKSYQEGFFYNYSPLLIKELQLI